LGREGAAQPEPDQEIRVVERPRGGSPHGFDEFVERHPGSTIFHGSAWHGLVERHFPHRPRHLEAWRGGRRTGVLPLHEVRSPLSGRAFVSVPYGVHGGPLASDEGSLVALVARVRAMVASEGARYAELRFREEPGGAVEESGPRLARSDLYATFERELPHDPDACLGLIPRKSRATARQAAERHGLELVEDPGGARELHRLFVLNKRRLGSPAFGRAWFEDLLALGRARVRLHFVRRDGEALVAVMSFLHRATWNPYYSGSVPGAERLGASNYAYWQLMRRAASEGFERFDFGRSRVGSGPFDFKRNMGFEPRILPYRWVLAPGESVPQVHPGNERFSLPRRVIQHLPPALASAIGPALMRLVP
jgi:FemAB-related protein (PEP-CTERM system-associated)